MEEYTTTVPKRKDWEKKQKNKWGVVLAAVGGGIVLVVLGFLGGIQYQKHAGNKGNIAQQRAGQGLAGRFGAGRTRAARGGFGTVTAVSATSITVQNSRTGESKTYAITNGTKVTNNGAAAAVSDIQTGSMVLVQTSTSDAGTATAIVINPSFGGGFGGTSDQLPAGSANSDGSSVNIN